MVATVSSPDASILATRLLGRRLRVSQCAVMRADPDLLRPVEDRGLSGLWVILSVTWSTGELTTAQVQVVTSRQRSGGERRWFACPRCGHRVGCLYSPCAREPFWCRSCYHLIYDSQYARRDAATAAMRAFLKLAQATARLERQRPRPRPTLGPRATPGPREGQVGGLP